MADNGVVSEQSEIEKKQIELLKSGVASAWKEILATHGPSLLAYATRMLGDKGTAEEVLQDSLVNIYKSIDGFDGRCSIKSWMYRAVHNRSIDEIRRRKRYVDIGADPEQDFFETDGHWQDEYPGWDGFASKQIDDKRMLQVVGQEINKLPHALREVLILKELEGLNNHEICTALDISAGNLRIRIHRARSTLREAVNKKLRDN